MYILLLMSFRILNVECDCEMILKVKSTNMLTYQVYHLVQCPDLQVLMFQQFSC